MVRILQIAVFIFTLSIFSACQVDKFSPCDANKGIPGMLCKEYHFQNDASIGYISYYYNDAGQAVRKDYLEPGGNLKMYTQITYDNGKLKKETSFNPDGKQIRETDYNYDNQENLSAIDNLEDGVQVSQKKFEYQGTYLSKESEFSNGSLENYITYQYFQDDNRLFKKSYYNAQHQLISYTTNEYFPNHITRNNHYAANNVFTGYDLTQADEEDLPLRFTSYNAQSNVMEYTDYEYDASGNLTKTTQFDENGKALSYIIYVYF